jgi:hypothetical protein
VKEEHLEVKRQLRRSAVETALDRLHVLVGVAAFAVFGGQAAGLWLDPRAHDDGAAKAEEAYVAFDDAANRASFPLEERLKETDGALAALGASLAPPASKSNAGLPRGLTYPTAYLETLKPGASNEIRFRAPVDLRAVAEVGGVDLAWADPAGNNVKIREFEILRAEGDGAESVLRTVPGSTFAYRDEGAQPGHEYAYRVRSIAAEGFAAAGTAAKSSASEPAKVRAIADFKIEPAGLEGDVLVLKVSKWSGGAWKDRLYRVKRGEPIGGKDDALGVDFSTGRRLAELTVETKTESRTKNEVVFEADGRVVVEAGAPKRVPVTADQPYLVASAKIDGGALPPETLVWDRR